MTGVLNVERQDHDNTHRSPNCTYFDLLYLYDGLVA